MNSRRPSSVCTFSPGAISVPRCGSNAGAPMIRRVTFTPRTSVSMSSGALKKRGSMTGAALGSALDSVTLPRLFGRNTTENNPNPWPIPTTPLGERPRRIEHELNVRFRQRRIGFDERAGLQHIAGKQPRRRRAADIRSRPRRTSGAVRHDRPNDSLLGFSYWMQIAIWSWRLRPTFGKWCATAMPWRCSSAASPTPERIRIAGDARAPPDRITSRCAVRVRAPPAVSTFTPVTRPFSTSTRSATASVDDGEILALPNRRKESRRRRMPAARPSGSTDAARSLHGSGRRNRRISEFAAKRPRRRKPPTACWCSAAPARSVRRQYRDTATRASARCFPSVGNTATRLERPARIARRRPLVVVGRMAAGCRPCR